MPLTVQVLWFYDCQHEAVFVQVPFRYDSGTFQVHTAALVDAALKLDPGHQTTYVSRYQKNLVRFRYQNLVFGIDFAE